MIAAFALAYVPVVARRAVAGNTRVVKDRFGKGDRVEMTDTAIFGSRDVTIKLADTDDAVVTRRTSNRINDTRVMVEDTGSKRTGRVTGATIVGSGHVIVMFAQRDDSVT